MNLSFGKPRSLRLRQALVCFCAAFLAESAARAHVGPPYPIIVDQPIPGHVVTVLADPDVGQSSFFIVLEPNSPTAAQAVSSVDLTVQPSDGRVAPVVLHATQEKARRHLRYVALPEFDRQEMWKVDVDIRLADGSNHHFGSEVEATPPGVGFWGLLLYSFPFVLFGGLWILVFLRKGRNARRNQGAATPFTYLPAPNVSSPDDRGPQA